MGNLWQKHALMLLEAYKRSAGPVQFELVTRAILEHIPVEPQRIIDIGGGFGEQAIMLARAGHSVVILDIDPNMLAIAAEKKSKESAEVSKRVELVLGSGENATDLVGTDFNLVCCHSVLMYQDNAQKFLTEIVKLVKNNGLISILSLNTQALAMRLGLQGKWKEASATIETGQLLDSQSLPVYQYSLSQVIEILEKVGAKYSKWYGIGIFTDHQDKVIAENPADVFELEWIAGIQDPYRQVARCFHLLAYRNN